MKSHIDDIRRWAKEIVGDSDQAQKYMIISWSAFSVEGGKTISITGKALEDISPGWLKQIWYKGRKAYEHHVVSTALVGDLFNPPSAPRPLTDGVYNHPKDLPF